MGVIHLGQCGVCFKIFISCLFKKSHILLFHINEFVNIKMAHHVLQFRILNKQRHVPALKGERGKDNC